MQAKDPTRPVFLNLGQGVANQTYIGWGSDCSQTHPADYPDYVAAQRHRLLRHLPGQRDRRGDQGQPLLRRRGRAAPLPTGPRARRPVWNWIECTGIQDPSGKPTPEDVKAEVWMSIVHGSMGIGYFVHQFQPSFDEHALLDDPTMKAAVSRHQPGDHLARAGAQHAAHRQRRQRELVGPERPGRHAAQAPGRRDLHLRGRDAQERRPKRPSAGSRTSPPAASVSVIGESRTLALSNASFSDDFAAYGVHLYQIE